MPLRCIWAICRMKSSLDLIALIFSSSGASGAMPLSRSRPHPCTSRNNPRLSSRLRCACLQPALPSRCRAERRDCVQRARQTFPIVTYPEVRDCSSSTSRRRIDRSPHRDQRSCRWHSRRRQGFPSVFQRKADWLAQSRTRRSAARNKECRFSYLPLSCISPGVSRAVFRMQGQSQCLKADGTPAPLGRITTIIRTVLLGRQGSRPLVTLMSPPGNFSL